MKKSDQYLKIVEWSEEDQCYIGSVPGWIGVCCHSDDEQDAYRQLCQIVDEWIKIYEEDGRPLPVETAVRSYSGKFMLRLDPNLHKQLAIHAARHGVSLNKYCTQHLEQAHQWANKKKYPDKSIYIVELMGYVCMVPYVNNDDEIYLKTIIPSRKMYKHYKG